MDEHNRTGLGPQGFMPHNSRGDQSGVPQYLGVHPQGKRRDIWEHNLNHGRNLLTPISDE
jgi:hypothetical protein